MVLYCHKDVLVLSTVSQRRRPTCTLRTYDYQLPTSINDIRLSKTMSNRAASFDYFRNRLLKEIIDYNRLIELMSK